MNCTKVLTTVAYAKLNPGLVFNCKNSFPNLKFTRGSLVKYSNYTTMSNFKLKPWWITGFIDAEGSFVVTILKSKDRKHGRAVRHKLSVGLHLKDVGLLKEIQKFFW